MTTHQHFGYNLRPVRPRAEQLATLRIGQLVQLRSRIVDRFPRDENHQLRVEEGAVVRITALAGHSGDHARYRFEIVDAQRRSTGLWNTASEEQLEALESGGFWTCLRNRIGGALVRTLIGA